VLASGLQGRGGAYFPAGRKWETARQYPGPRYLVANAEEGEPGVFKDRYLLEYDPHLVLEGVLIAAHAIEAAHVFVYINGEADVAAARLQTAVNQAAQAGLCHALTSLEPGTEDRPLVEVRRGAGGYVCGEESVILSSIEGDRAVPRLRPPLPVERGLWGRPTVINNVETLANVPSIMTDGVEAFRSVGLAGYPGTKVISLSGAVARPGLYEVPLGTPLRTVLFDLGGGPRAGRRLQAAVCGGPSGGLLPGKLFDTALTGGSLDPGGAALGAGGIVAIDEAMRPIEVVQHLAAYNAAESCGKCTPCREGAPRMRDLLSQLRSQNAPADAIELLGSLEEALALASLCQLGQLASMPYRSLRTHYPEELTAP
jgi:NADH:ubiquinone oxidoreductase subunit F (NADH-binding)